VANCGQRDVSSECGDLSYPKNRTLTQNKGEVAFVTEVLTMSHEAAVTIRDVTPRDGLQSETPLPAAARVELVLALAAAGVAHIEAASFVSPRHVPAMAEAADVFAQAPAGGSIWWALVPNSRGALDALAAGARHLTVTVSASPQYSIKNVGRSIHEAISGLRDIAAVVGEASSHVDVDVVVSCAFGSPFGDVTSPAPVVELVESILGGVPSARLTLADTTGTGTPRRIGAVIDALPAAARIDLGLHLHDTRGTALANALWSLERGICRFDTAVGGLGGSPFAPGAGGNLATEDLVMVLDDMGIDTGIHLDAILSIADGLPDLIGHAVPSRTSAAGPLSPFDSACPTSGTSQRSRQHGPPRTATSPTGAQSPQPTLRPRTKRC
jgi:hydroxymethylglutaryl-CoA lyase